MYMDNLRKLRYREKIELIKERIELFDTDPQNNYNPYDVKIFELLPLRIKMSIIKDHIVVYGNELELSEYFYHYRKLWMDSKHRIINQF